MATTRLIVHHITKGSTAGQTMKGRFDYGQNPLKTHDGGLVLSYECDAKTAYREFALSKAKYRAITGRKQKKSKDVLCYQIRQSFLPGEVDAEGALKIGYDLGMRWTKGKHAFFVVSHIDRPHPHIHIYYNSTALDCTRKFRNLNGSVWALRRLSDRICIENRLSYIARPKPKSKSKYRHYGEWLGADRKPGFKTRIKAKIDACLARKPKSFEEFLRAMQEAGAEMKRGRGGAISFRVEGQDRFTRLRASTLGEGYGEEDIRAVIDGRADDSGNTIPRRKISLVIDIQERMKTGKGPGYERWAKVFNLKQMAAAVQYLQENDLFSYEDLEAKALAAADRFHSAAGNVKRIEDAMKRNTELKKAIVEYARTRPVFEEYKARKYSNKYLAEHEAEILVYRAAKASMKEILQGAKLPKMDELKAEWQSLAAKKKSGYAEYRAAQKQMREAVTVKANICCLLGITGKEKNKEMTR